MPDHLVAQSGRSVINSACRTGVRAWSERAATSAQCPDPGTVEGRQAVHSRPTGRPSRILELHASAGRRDERRAGARPIAGRSPAPATPLCPRRRLGESLESEWLLLHQLAQRARPLPATTMRRQAQTLALKQAERDRSASRRASILLRSTRTPRPAAPMCSTPAFCSPTQVP